jgi:glutathione S-transferase
MLSLKGERFEWVETDVLKRETRSAEFLALNPNGRVPLLQILDGRCLAESNAMLLYLAEGTRYVPEDAWLRAKVFEWLFFEQYSHEPYIAVARFIVHLAGKADEQAERLQHLYKQGNHALGVMEQALEATPFMAGDHFTIADIALYAYTHTAEDGGFDLSPFSAIGQWIQRVTREPGYLSMAEACK